MNSFWSMELLPYLFSTAETHKWAGKRTTMFIMNITFPVAFSSLLFQLRWLDCALQNWNSSYLSKPILSWKSLLCQCFVNIDHNTPISSKRNKTKHKRKTAIPVTLCIAKITWYLLNFRCTCRRSVDWKWLDSFFANEESRIIQPAEETRPVCDLQSHWI